jgi:CBS domain-containing protein
MKCEEIMIHGPSWCVPTDTAATVAKLMKAENLDSVPVCKSRRNRHLIGMVTNHDIVCHIVTEKRNADRTTVQEIMKREPVTCEEDDDLGVALEAMRRNPALRIPVVDGSAELIGVIALGDAILWTGEPKGIIEAIKGMTQIHRAQRSQAKTVNAESGKPKVRHGGESSF